VTSTVYSEQPADMAISIDHSATPEFELGLGQGDEFC
jgi:hypothetical protein